MDPPVTAQAQASTSVLTVVASDGSLWALPEGQAPVLIRGDLGAGGAVTDIAWNPLKPELLIVRREVRRDHDYEEPFDQLVRLDLGMQQEEVLERDVGPQARILRPQWGPDGTWGYARIECCLARELLRFNFPTRPGSPNYVDANSFLPQDLQEITLAEAGPTTPAGRILMAVYCCSGPEPESDPSGVYAVSLNLQQSERLTRGMPGDIVGMAPDGSWVSTLRISASSDDYDLMIWRQSGELAVIPPPAGVTLADRGRVTADGRITVAATVAPAQGIVPSYSTIWSVGPDGTGWQNASGAFPTEITAFDVAPAAVLAMTAPGLLPGAAPPVETATRVFFGRDPESLEDFTAVFPVGRGPLSPLASVLELIQGPTLEEAQQGYRSELRLMLRGESNCDGQVELSVADGTAVVRFCREVASAGIGQDARMASQVNATLLQFPSIKQVRLLDRTGRCLMDMSGMDQCLRS
jgi:hypothetical protein